MTMHRLHLHDIKNTLKVFEIKGDGVQMCFKRSKFMV